MIIFCSGFPNEWKVNRTTLIPKPGKDLNKVENWRPITIGPILDCIFLSVIDGTLRRKMKNNESQKGFTQQNGCKQNIELLNTALKTCKIYDGGVFIIVDIAKAFDTVPHKILEPCLRKKGIPTPVIDLINEMYKEFKTTIRTGKNEGVEMEMLRGVKQGDPLSPLLFNVCLDPLLEEIQKEIKGININLENKVSVLAFVNDFILLGKDEKETQVQINILNKYLSALHIKISKEKFQTF
jgi:hypothetical protein